MKILWTELKLNGPGIDMQFHLIICMVFLVRSEKVK